MDPTSITSIEAELALLYTTVQQTYSANYHEVAGVTVLLYDILLNLDNEVEVFWQTRWSFPKALYFIARYFAPLDLLILLSFDVQIGLSIPVRSLVSPSVQSGLKHVHDIGLSRLVVVDDNPRTRHFSHGRQYYPHSAYACDIRQEQEGADLHVYYDVLRICGTYHFVQHDAQSNVDEDVVYSEWSHLLVNTGSDMRANSPLSPDMLIIHTEVTCSTHCLFDTARVSSITIGFISMTMTLYRYIYTTGGMSWQSARHGSPLFRVIVRDGVMYWFLIFAADLFAALMTLDTHTPITRVGVIWFVVAYSIAGSQILLHLRTEAKNISPGDSNASCIIKITIETLPAVVTLPAFSVAPPLTLKWSSGSPGAPRKTATVTQHIMSSRYLNLLGAFVAPGMKAREPRVQLRRQKVERRDGGLGILQELVCDVAASGICAVNPLSCEALVVPDATARIPGRGGGSFGSELFAVLHTGILIRAGADFGVQAAGSLATQPWRNFGFPAVYSEQRVLSRIGDAVKSDSPGYNSEPRSRKYSSRQRLSAPILRGGICRPSRYPSARVFHGIFSMGTLDLQWSSKMARRHPEVVRDGLGFRVTAQQHLPSVYRSFKQQFSNHLVGLKCPYPTARVFTEVPECIAFSQIGEGFAYWIENTCRHCGNWEASGNLSQWSVLHILSLTMDPASIQADLALLYTAVQQTYSANYHETAAIAVLLYDTLLNLDTEIEVIWKKNWSLPKILYLIARYWAPLDLLIVLSFDIQIGLPTPRRCRWSLWMMTIPGPVIFPAIVNVILILRMHALFGKNRKVLIFMCIMMFFDFACSFCATLLASLNAQVASVPAFVGLPGCATSLSVGKLTLVGWYDSLLIYNLRALITSTTYVRVPTIIVGFTCMMMTLYQCIRATGGFSWQFRSQFSPLFRIIIRDGVFYWFLIFAASLFDAFMILDTHTPITRVGFIWNIVAYSIAGTRILLNLRAQALKTIAGSRGCTQPVEDSVGTEMFAHDQSALTDELSTLHLAYP
ncbi:hypothetical protein NM688_g4854 [Phlebia brevispora]|uniref:Uncharacterized protein n=1 Tax=Phlebia brevispora TaxID=194682 RepID=A0ACC1T1S1_9APHY|nr:hypothetical protein NM688_g4854 [Phlebia brevispora]